MPDNKFTRHAIDSSFPQDLCKNVEETLENQSLKDSTIKVLAVGTKLEVVTALNRYRECPPKFLLTSESRYGFIAYYPGRSSIGPEPTILAPMVIYGEVEINGEKIEPDSYYKISAKCDIFVANDGRLIAAVGTYLEISTQEP